MGPAFDRQGGYQALVMRLADVSSFDAFKKSVEGNPQLQVTMRQERAFYDEQAGPVGTALTTLAWFVSLIMAIGAVTGAMNTMFAIVSSRTREIGTLRALGFSRAAILMSFVLESAVLALVGRRARMPARGAVQRHDGRDLRELQRPRICVPRDDGDAGGGDRVRVADGRVRRAAAGDPRGTAADHVGVARGVAAQPSAGRAG